MIRLTPKSISMVLLPVLLSFGCVPSDEFDTGGQIEYTVQLRSGMVLEDEMTGRLSLLRVTANTVVRKPLFSPAAGETISRMFPGHTGVDSDTLCVLTRATDSRRTDVHPTLHVINGATGQTTRYTVGSQFSKHRFSPDGRMLILYHGENDSYEGGLGNPNEIAVVNLDAAPVSLNDTAPVSVPNPRFMSIDIAGHTISDIHFPGTIQVGATARNFVAFVTEGAIQFTDFNEKTLPSITVSLKNETDSRQIVPTRFEIVHGDATHDPRIFVQASNASELYDIELHERMDDIGYYATTSLLDGGSQPADFTVVQDDGEILVVSTAASRNQIHIFEASTARVTTLEVTSRLTSILNRTGDRGAELVLYGNGNRIYFLAADGLRAEMGDNLAYMNIPEGIRSVRVLDDDRLLIQPQTSGLIIVDLRTRTLTHLKGQINFNPAKNLLWQNTLFLTSSRTVHYLGILTGSPGALELDEPIDAFHIFAAQGVGMAIHDTPTGRVTVFPLSAPERARCRVTDGFLITGILNRGEE